MSARRQYRQTSEDAEPSPLFGLIAKLGLGLFLLTIVLAPLVGGYPAGITYGADMALAALRCLTLLAGVFVAAFARPLRGTVPGIFIWLTVAGTVISLLVHSGFLGRESLLFAMVPATLDWLSYAAAFTLAAHLAQEGSFKDTHRPVWWVAGALVAGGAVSAVLGAVESLTSTLPGARAQSPFFSPNFLGGFLGVCLPITAAWFAATSKRTEQIALGIAAALMGGTLVATGSRAGLALTVGGLVVALILALIIRRAKLPWARVGILAAALLVTAFVFRGALVTRATEGGSQDYSGQYRSWTWKGSAAMAAANPTMGTGPGTFPYLYPKYALVAKTELAHSSYWQLAAEEGYPTLILALLTVVAVILTTLIGLFMAFTMVAVGSMTQGEVKLEEELATATLLCGLLGGILVGALRSVFDSEWSLLGNGIPFWAVLGLATGVSRSLWTAAGGREGQAAGGWQERVPGFALIAVLLIGLLPAFRVLYGIQARDNFLAQLQQGQRPESLPEVWPSDPQLLGRSGSPDKAAAVDPSAKRYYQLGRSFEVAGQIPQAITAIKEATSRDPNALQIWRKLAELQEQSGDHAGALQSWRELVTREEGPVGKIRAIPELRETHAAFAYAALAKDTAASDKAAAIALYEKGAAVVEDYARTSPLYQKMEVASAAATGADVAKRRQELRDLYVNIIRDWSGLEPGKATELAARRDETLRRLDAFIPLESPGNVAPAS